MMLKDRLEALGFVVLETYPGAAQDLLGIKRRRDRLGLQMGLRSLDIGGDVNKPGITDHELDAITCAFVAGLYVEGDYLLLGEPEENLMVLPNRRAGILK